ncbi:MAG: hypothetical protein LBB68_10010 [Treponema sp.]|jgi:hypothetical protein|nr:hypothetical protein [Treponema sp.]
MGHGKDHASEIYAILNLPEFLMHGLMPLVEEDLSENLGLIGEAGDVFEVPRFSFRRFPHESWEGFLIFVLGDEPEG